MKITVNDKPYELGSSVNLVQLMTHLNVAETGTAIAINQAIISRPLWPEQSLNDGDRIMIIQATAGG